MRLQKIEAVTLRRYFKNLILSWPSGMPPLKPIAVQPMAMWRIHVDVFGPLDMSRNGNRYVALGVCALVKYVEAKGKSSII